MTAHRLPLDSQPPTRQVPSIGVLAIQGDFEAHAALLRALGADPRRVRTPADLDGLDGLIIPGGESTTISLGVEREGLGDPLRELAASGAPILGTCAGLILLDRDHLGIIDITSRRNAFGRQVRSFECDLQVDEWGSKPLRAVFIRAPWVEQAGDEVEILAELEGHPVAVRQGSVLAVAFHPELALDPRLHQWLITRTGERPAPEPNERRAPEPA